MAKGDQLQTRVSPYYRWVVEGLVGSFGRNRSDVVSKIIGEWIEDRADRLATRGLGLKQYQSPRRVPGEDARPESPASEESVDQPNGNGANGG